MTQREKEIKISAKDNDISYGSRITLYPDGTLTINGYDGMTKLNVEEAKELVLILKEWIDE